LESVEYVLVAVSLELGLGLSFALLLCRKVKLKSLYETFYFIPSLPPMVPSAIVGNGFSARDRVGLENYRLNQMGLANGWAG
jgi:ABC-type sugar transport system permease subunit